MLSDIRNSYKAPQIIWTIREKIYHVPECNKAHEFLDYTIVT